MTDTKPAPERSIVGKIIRWSDEGESGRLVKEIVKKLLSGGFSKVNRVPTEKEFVDIAHAIPTAPHRKEGLLQKLDYALGAPRIPATRNEITRDDQIDLTDTTLTVSDDKGSVIKVALAEIKGVSFELTSE